MLLEDGSIWRMRDLREKGFTATTVQRAVAAGTIEMVSRGLYRRQGAPAAPNALLAEVSARSPDGVVCLLSAAHYHGLIAAAPDQVWLAIANNRTPPKLERPPVRAVRWRGSASLAIGVQENLIQGVRIRITSPARTVVDMIRMLDAVGEDAALECLHAYLTAGGAAEEVRDIAGTIGVGKLVKPYISLVLYMEANHEEHLRIHPRTAPQ